MKQLTKYMCVLCIAVVVIPSEETTAMITVNVVDDNIPELNEMFSIRLTSVELVDGSEDVTVLPTLGTSTEVTITIESSDDPFGSISLTQETYNVIEGNAVTLSLVRSRGSLGVTTITYATVNGRATSPEDFVETSGTLVFIQGQTSGEILVPTNNDSIPEVFEDFGFALLGVSQGSLGNITRATIIIAASDSPFGVVGFRSEDVSAGVSIANPTTSPAMVRLIVSRMGGTLGNTDITWNVTGPGSNGVPTSDISSSSIRGILTLGDGQRYVCLATYSIAIPYSFRPWGQVTQPILIKLWYTVLSVELTYIILCPVLEAL